MKAHTKNKSLHQDCNDQCPEWEAADTTQRMEPSLRILYVLPSEFSIPESEPVGCVWFTSIPFDDVKDKEWLAQTKHHIPGFDGKYFIDKIDKKMWIQDWVSA